MELTDKEKKVLSVFRIEGETCCLVDNAQDMKDQNMSYAILEDVMEQTGYNSQQVGGIVASLLEKDLLIPEEHSEGKSMWFLSDLGIDAAYANPENNLKYDNLIDRNSNGLR